MPRVEIFNREQVLDQMVEVFHHKGYNGTSMQDLVDASKLNRSSLYNSFGNKLAIFLECLKAYQQKTNRQTSSLLLKSSNALEAIEFIFKMNSETIAKDKQHKGCLISNCTSEMANQDVRINSFLKSNQNDMIGFLGDIISDGQQEGIINKNKSPRAYALYLFSALQGFRSTGILLDDEQQLNSIVDIVLSNLK